MNRARRDRMVIIGGGAALGLAALALFFTEKKRPLRKPTQAEPGRSIANLALGAMSMATVALIEAPLTKPLSERARRERDGLVQMLPLPAWARDAAAVVLMDYTIYLWHVATHKVPFLWRFHLVHHVDLDLDTTTALRFHAADMAISAPYRAAQVALIGVSPRALKLWQGWFFFSILFHHSNIALPERLERLIARIVTTPRMHGIHHSALQNETGSNWSSGFALWDHLNGSFRFDVPQADITIGVPAYSSPEDIKFAASLAMPFGHERDAWTPSDRKPTAIQ
jgi:sterol desaturase/sphingolipid hydroxylase (fatty acid hydroxylase superfamily)